MKKVFISRDLNENSIFLKELNASNFEVHGESLLSFTPIPFKHSPASDWLFFYSQRGVQFFFDQYEKIKTSHSFQYKCAAIGPVTAKALKYYLDEDPQFVGTGYPKKTAELFYEIAAGDHVCFVRAEKSMNSVQNLLLGHLQDIDLVVYDNKFRTDFELPHFDILVFTSPMNAQAYFSKYQLKKDQQVVAIGPTTNAALMDLGVACIVSEYPSEAGLVACCLGLV